MFKIANLGKIGKKKIIISVIIVLILVAGGFFWWWQGREIKGGPDDYVIKETEEGKIVENKKAGLSIKIPEGWTTEKIEAFEGSVLICTPEITGRKNGELVSPPLTKGCGIEISVIYKKMNFNEIKEEIKAIHWGLNIKSEEFEEITINNRSALKNIFDSEFLGPATAVYIPTENKLYDFDLYWAPDEKERCVQEFDKFLETISID